MKSIFLLIFSSVGEIKPKYVLPSLIFLRELSCNPKELILIFKFFSKNKLSIIVNSNFGTFSFNSFNFNIVSSDASSFILLSESIEISFSFAAFFIVWSWVFKKFLSE